jgi:hypothetical protein
LARGHSRTTKEERRYVQRYVDGLEDVAYSIPDVRFPGPEDLPAIPRTISTMIVRGRPRVAPIPLP